MKKQTHYISDWAIKQLNRDAERAKTKIEYLTGISGKGSISEFEKKFLRASGGGYAIAMSNCSSAILTALISCGIEPGDEVILPAFSWPQTLAAALLLGATPIFVDCSERSLNADVNLINEHLTHKTKAIIIAHLYGIPAEIPNILSKYSSVTVIYDAAQAFGSSYKDRKLADAGHFTTFSFGMNKLLNIGEGGMLVCNTRKKFEEGVYLSQHPFRQHRQIDDHHLRRTIDGVNLNFRMHPLIASLGIGQLKYFIRSAKKLKRKYNKLRMILKKNYLEEFLPTAPKNAEPMSHGIPLIVPETKKTVVNRTLKVLGLKYAENHLLPLYRSHTIKQAYKKVDCPRAEQTAKAIIIFVYAND